MAAYDQPFFTNTKDFSYFSDYYNIKPKEAFKDQIFAHGWLGFVSSTLTSKGTHYERRAYNFFDLMSEMGGISSTIFSVSVLLVGAYNFAIYKIEAVTTSF